MRPIDPNDPKQNKPVKPFNLVDMVLAIARSILLPLAIGWLWALLVIFVLSQLQANEIARSYLPARLDMPLSSLLTVKYISTDIMAQLDRDLRHGALLLLSQIGIISGVLAWQVNLTARSIPRPRLYGALCGGVVGLVEAMIGVIMGAPLTFSIPLGIALLMVGLYAGVESGVDSTAVAPLTAASADQSHS